MSTEKGRSDENEAPRFHSWQCMEAWMHPCRCGVTPPAKGNPGGAS